MNESQMTAAAGSALEDIIHARRSVRQYQPNVAIPDETLNEILELAAAAPSSWNLQHWRFLVIKDQARKDRIKAIAYGQQQVSDASVIVVILGDLEANKTAADLYEAQVAAGTLPQKVLDTLVGQIEAAYQNAQFARDEANKNAGLAAMQLMLAAKAKGYDTVPMGGFDPAALVRELNIPPRYFPVMMIPIGLAAAPARQTERLPLSTLVVNETF
ncbi:nitroreductase family protein [Paenibacillus humicola]|uniref:nitroreductase family protein n=1 Tax=Paenibacillus humicola TaxID=3110540 RepID=UPI00237C3799|nr:nitroreductase family protein [Paenibacillus humicola]